MTHRCMSTLAEIDYEGYSTTARRRLAGGNRKFPHRLTLTRQEVVAVQVKTAERMSISGVQDKISLRLERGALLPTDKHGEYILKPIPSAIIPSYKDDVPANEHLTMQIAEQIFGIATAVNACVYLADGEPAYIAKRFDCRGGQKIAQEDFCQLGSITEETHGRNFRYESTYEAMGKLLRRFCKAYPVEVEKLFHRILFCYVFSNGDAHMKNFSLYETNFGDYILTPAYDLICSSMHFPGEQRMAFDLFDDYVTESFKANAFYKREDFVKLAEFFRIRSRRAEGYLNRFIRSESAVCDMVQRSFLSNEAKADYRRRFCDRLRAIAT